MIFARILLVEDDEIVREVIAAGLRSAGLTVQIVGTAAEARALLAMGLFDLAVVDVHLPDGLGVSLLPARIPIILMTSNAGPADRAAGLDRGADDYILKPVDGTELLARIRAVLRRSAADDRRDNVTVLDGWMLDLVRRELLDTAGMTVRLTRAEFDVFAAIVQSSPVALHRDYLVEVIASLESGSSARTVDVLISRIRRKFAGAAPPAPTIATRRNEGYWLPRPARQPSSAPPKARRSS